MTKSTTSPQRTDRIVARITTTLAGLLVLALLVWGGRIGWAMRHYETTDDAQVEEYINPINSKVSGYIRQIHYQENEAVKAGDTLVVARQPRF